MASLQHHKKSPYWYASFRKPDGTWALRSTKSKNRQKAVEICQTWEKAARDAERGRLTEHAARKVISEIYAIAHEEPLSQATVSEFFDSWLNRKQLENADGTFRKYKDVVTQFRTFLGERLEQDLSRISNKHIAGFRDSLAKKLTAGTTNLALKILRMVFGQAKREGYITENPAENVDMINRREERVERRPFTLPELKRIYDIAKDEWKGMIMFGLYTGQRMKDIATLTWQNLDLERNEMKIVTTKTGRRQIIPLAKPLVSYLASLPAGDNPKQPVFPKIFADVQKNGTTGHLSNQFYEILVSAGLALERKHKGNGKGRSTKRQTSELSFHCLRHTATSLLKNAGVSDAVAREFIGHDSPAISQNYTHIETESLRKAADLMPVITSHEQADKK
jgi:integrase